MITEDYCSYKISKLLEEKGFPMGEYLFMHVNKDNVFMTDDYACLKLPWEEYKNFDEVFIPTITHQMAMKWLREKHNIIIIPQPEYFSCDRCESWGIDIWASDNYEKLQGDFPTYEEAVEAALKYCLTELI